MKRSGPPKRRTPLTRSPFRRARHPPARPAGDAGTPSAVHDSDALVPGTARELALARDSLGGWPACALAGWTVPGIGCSGGLDVHHRMLIGAGGTSRADRDWLPRLITLCRAHHWWAHDRERLLAEHAGIIVRRGAYLARLDEIPVRYALSPTRWALLAADGHAVPCPPPPTSWKSTPGYVPPPVA